MVHVAISREESPVRALAREQPVHQLVDVNRWEDRGAGNNGEREGTEVAARTYGLIRPFKLAVIAGTAIFPPVHIDQLMHWLLPRQSTDRRFLTTYRDVYHLARTFLLILGLRSSGHNWAVLVGLYFIGEIVHGAIA